MFAGCAHILSDVLEAVQFEGLEFTSESGGTAAHLYRAQHSYSRSGHAVAKIFCMPKGKRTRDGTHQARPGCSHKDNEVCVSKVPVSHASRC